MNTYLWYQQLVKPSWAPPNWLFGPVWAVLYIGIGISFAYVGYMFLKRKLPLAVALPFVLNPIFNLAFTPIQFGLRNNVLALVDILLVLVTLVWAMIAVLPYFRWVAYANIPYLLWVCFATILQATITFLNR